MGLLMGALALSAVVETPVLLTADCVGRIHLTSWKAPSQGFWALDNTQMYSYLRCCRRSLICRSCIDGHACESFKGCSRSACAVTQNDLDKIGTTIDTMSLAGTLLSSLWSSVKDVILEVQQAR